MTFILRYDTGEIKQHHLTEEGFLNVDAIVTRTGVFEYLNNDGSIRRELRHPEDVLKDDSLNSMKLLPITLMHPKERVVDSDNAKKLSVGTTGESLNHDGRLIKTNILITDKNAIKAVEDGIQELSLGYRVKLVEDSGEFQGERYDVRQTDIKYNHLAIVPRGRAGEAKIILDSADAVQKQTIDNRVPKPKEKTMNLVKRNLDGITYDAAPEIVNALDKAIAASKTTADELKIANDSISEIQAKLDAANEKIAEFEKVDHAAEIAKGVKARSALVAAAMKHLDAKVVEGIEEKTDSEIKVMVIEKYRPNFNKDGANEENIKNDVYLQAAFEAALENEPAQKNDNGLADQRRKMRGVGKNDSADDKVEKARNDNKNYLENAWKNQPEPAKA